MLKQSVEYPFLGFFNRFGCDNIGGCDGFTLAFKHDASYYVTLVDWRSCKAWHAHLFDYPRSIAPIYIL